MSWVARYPKQKLNITHVDWKLWVIIVQKRSNILLSGNDTFGHGNLNFYKTKYGNRIFKYNGPRFWNPLLPHIQARWNWGLGYVGDGGGRGHAPPHTILPRKFYVVLDFNLLVKFWDNPLLIVGMVVLVVICPVSKTKNTVEYIYCQCRT